MTFGDFNRPQLSSTYPSVVDSFVYLHDRSDGLKNVAAATRAIQDTLGTLPAAQDASTQARLARLDGAVVNVKNPVYAGGAKGDGSTDDTAAVQAALTAAAGATLYLPPGTYPIATELAYNTASLGTTRIVGSGRSSILKATGASNKVLHISGTAGSTTPFVELASFQVQSGTSGVSSDGIHIDGIAGFWIHDVVVDGKNKMTNALRCTGSQQGEISGGMLFGATNGLVVEPSGGGVHANGLDIHGMSIFCSGTNVTINTIDSLFFIGNHLTTAPIGIDCTAFGNGHGIIAYNHIESHTTAGVRLGGRCQVVGNQFFAGASGVDLKILNNVNQLTVADNFFTGNVTFDAGSSDLRLMNNRFLSGSVLTDNSAFTTKIGNTNSGAAGSATNTVVRTLTYSASIATDASLANTFVIAVTNGTAFTINNPTNAITGQTLTYDIKNSSGGAHGVITWGAGFLNGGAGTVGTGAFAGIANGKRRTISFYYDGSNWIEMSRTADI